MANEACSEGHWSFDGHALDGQKPTSSYDLLAFSGATYLSDVDARFAHECRGIRPNVVHMMNDSGILVVNYAKGNTIQIVSHCVMMVSRAQPAMIGKKLA